MNLPKRVNIVEVAPRDGLQNEATPVPTERKLEFIRRLAETGVRQIEATSFVHPKAVPQLADAADVVAGLPKADGVVFSVLTPNRRGLDRAIDAGVRRIAVFTAASETFNQNNIRMSIAESLDAFAPLVADARSHGIEVRAYLSTCFVCPYEGDIAKEPVRDIARKLLDMGAYEVSISDTIGAATPVDVRATVGHLLEVLQPDQIALHFHDTYGTAIANVYAGLELGIATFDASAGGLGGCPFAPGATGNVATEDVVYLCNRMGVETGVDLHAVVCASDTMAEFFNRRLPAKQWQRLRAGGCDPAV